MNPRHVDYDSTVLTTELLRLGVLIEKRNSYRLLELLLISASLTSLRGGRVSDAIERR